jgi:lipoprotein-anchoring transpeptidase ErfK/SrfK
VRRLAFGPILVVLAVVPGTAGAAGSDATPRDVASANVARFVAPTPARPRLDGPATRTIGPVAPLAGGQTQLRVVARRSVGGRWFVRVLLPERPNGSSVWVAADRVVLLRTRWHVYVDRRARRLVVTRGGRRVRSARVVVGAPRSPTPAGEFALSERIAQKSAHGFVGPWVLAITAFSGTYRQFDGGPGRVAIHGRGGASLRDPLGTARSHGCVRVANGLIRWMARHLQAGTPVTIR